MSKALPTVAKLAALGALIAFSALSVPTTSYANGPSAQSCHVVGPWWNPKLVCKKTGSRDLPDSYLPQSTELFPDRCNGELGFWQEPIVFGNGETFCIARSTADFYHNGITVDGGTVGTCNVTVQKPVVVWNNGHPHISLKTVYEKSTDGACQSSPQP
jgi:hypothetical protein